jgi:hypothetical protein
MYPAEYYCLFPPFPRKNEIFVAMSFSEEFRPRWENVIIPAVKRIAIDNNPLGASRVDVRTVGDSILTEILTGISQSRLVFADITTIGTINDKPVRNGNVLYEVGLAQAVRLPEEVLLFRSDSDPLLFDVANIRVNSYDPDGDPEQAKSQIVDSILSALTEVELKRHLTVQRAAESLDFPSWSALALAAARAKAGITHPIQRTMGQIVGSFSQTRAISRLLEIGALRTQYQKVTPELFSDAQDEQADALLHYKCTEFGVALFDYAVEQLGLLEPNMIKYFEEKIADGSQESSGENHT